MPAGLIFEGQTSTRSSLDFSQLSHGEFHDAVLPTNEANTTVHDVFFRVVDKTEGREVVFTVPIQMEYSQFGSSQEEIPSMKPERPRREEVVAEPDLFQSLVKNVLGHTAGVTQVHFVETRP